MNILITGASGQVGQAIQRHYQQNTDDSCWLASRKQELPSPLHRYFDFTDPSGSRPTLAQTDVLFLLRPPQLADVNGVFAPLLQTAVSEGVKHILFLSVQGADDMSFIPHAKIEALIRQLPVSYTFFRPSYFMQNLETSLRKEIIEQDRIFLPSGKKPFLWIDVDDIGRAIARVLESPETHQNQVYTLTGTDLLPFGAVADMLSEVLERPIHYRSPNPLFFAWYQRRRGTSWGYIGVLLLLHFLARFQPDPVSTDDIVRLTQKEPTSLRSYLEAHREVWSS